MKQDLGDALAGAHDVRGSHGLVRRDKDEAFDAVLTGRFDDDGAALDVVQNGLPGVFLQHGDVLVGCSMEHHLGLIGCADAIHQRNILNVAQNGPAAVEIEFVPKLHLDFKEVFLACVKQDQILRLKGDDLAAEFGADARVYAMPIRDCTQRMKETLVCLKEQSSRRVVATFLEIVRESLHANSKNA